MTPEHVQSAVCLVYDVTPQQQRSVSRAPAIVAARHAGMQLCVDLIPGITYRQIAEAFDRDTGSIAHALKAKTDGRYETARNLLRDFSNPAILAPMTLPPARRFSVERRAPFFPRRLSDG
jgi:chromosomal replication initiation ATPase DnaA